MSGKRVTFIGDAMAAVIQGVGEVRTLIGQPPVVGEIIAGILLGPTLFHGKITATLFPATLRPPLSALANLGVVMFMFAVGYLLAPKMGTDLSAQVAHADFWSAFGATPVDLRWYGGSEQFGYSLVSPAVMALPGPAYNSAAMSR